MAGHIPCTCEGTRKEKMKNWRVSMRNFNRSAFESPKYAEHPSAYSTVVCTECFMNIRSKAAYVDSLPDLEE